MADAVLFEMEGDASGALAAFAEVDAALAALEERLAAFGESMASFGAVDDAVAGVAASADAAAGSADALAGSADAVATSADAASGSLGAMAAANDTLSASAEGASASLAGQAAAADGLAASADAGGLAVAASATKLKMVGLAAGAAALGMVYFGSKAQDSLTTLQAMAGASTQQMQLYTQATEQLSEQYGSSMAKTADGLYFVISAGFAGKDAVTVLNQAMKAAAAGNADAATVTDALTSALNAYGVGADQAQHYTDLMVDAVVQGKQTFADFASSISAAAVAGHTAGFSFQEVSAAEATMTQTGVVAHTATQQLRFLFNSIQDPGKVGNAARAMGLAFDDNAYASMNLIQRLEYLKQTTAGNVTEFDKLVGGIRGSNAAAILLTTKNGQVADTYNTIYAAMNHASDGAGKTSDAFAAHQQALSFHVGQAVASLSVLAYQIESAVSPALSKLFDGISAGVGAVANFVGAHQEIVLPFFAALALLLGGMVATALYSFAASALAAAFAENSLLLPVIAIAAAIAGLALLVNLIVQHFGGWAAIGRALHPILAQVGLFVTSLGRAIGQAFAGAHLQSSLQQFRHALAQLAPLGHLLLPVLAAIGIVVGTMLAAALLVVTGLITGLVAALPGVITWFSGVINIIQGLGRLVRDIFTGQWSDILPAIKQIGHGVIQFFVGPLQAVAGFVTGFVTGIIHAFQNLFDALVGHSIIPDLVARITSLFGDLVHNATDFGTNLVKNLVGGIEAHIPGVKGAVDAIKNVVGNILQGHSPPLGWPEQGDYGANLVRTFASGITRTLPTLDAALGTLASRASVQLAPQVALPAAAAASSGTLGRAGAGAGGGDGATLALLGRMAGALDGLARGGGGGTGSVSSSSTTIGGTSLTLNGVPTSAVQQIAQRVLTHRDDLANLATRRPGGYRRPGWIG